MAQGGRPVPARRKMNVDLSSKTRLVQSFAVVTSAATAEEQVELARQCIVAVQPRSARYELVHFHMILQWNQVSIYNTPSPSTVPNAQLYFLF